MHPAVQARLDNLKKRGIFPGNDTGVEYTSGKEVVHEFDYCQMRVSPGQTEAWCFADVEHLARFRPSPGQ
jgi:hypothetical protein